MRRCNILGLGLIGGSLAAALTAQGWRVSGSDARVESEGEAIALGLIHEIGIVPDKEFREDPLDPADPALNETLKWIKSQ